MDRFEAEEMSKLDTWKLHAQEQQLEGVEKKLTKLYHSIEILIESNKQTRKDIEINHDKLVTCYKMLVRLEDYIFKDTKASHWLQQNWLSIMLVLPLYISLLWR
jgi:hypothetical protein